MVQRVTLAVLAAAGLSACASVMGDTESQVSLRTNPAGADCQLTGRDGYQASARTPATVTIPHTAAPVTVRCVATGFKPTSVSLDATADGWMWGNAGLIMGTGGAIILGMVVDESRGAGRAFQEDVEVNLDREQPRAVWVRGRADGSEMMLRAR
ncbi:MAG: hypothetical protein AB1918_09800 [Pseudomonadota bacterium]